LHLSRGVYVDLAYELREIEYTVESVDEDVIAAKAAWKTAETTYQKTPTSANKIAMQTAYDNYLEVLQTAIDESAQEEFYVL
jgi:hypothetical protein